MLHYHHSEYRIARSFIPSALLLSSLFLTGCHESMEKRCAREAREYTEKLCPAPVAKDIIIDSMGFDASTHTLSYYYSLQNKLDNAAALNASKSNLQKQLLEGVKNATNLKSYKEDGYNFCYTYYSSSHPGVVLYQITFSKKDYQ